MGRREVAPRESGTDLTVARSKLWYAAVGGQVGPGRLLVWCSAHPCTRGELILWWWLAGSTSAASVCSTGTTLYAEGELVVIGV